jgi:hypothetical protein
MLTYNILFVNILYYKNKLYINKLIYNLLYIYIYIQVDPYTSGFTSFNRVKPGLYKFVSFHNQA